MFTLPMMGGKSIAWTETDTDKIWEKKKRGRDILRIPVYHAYIL